jgi:hypothetical protein
MLAPDVSGGEACDGTVLDGAAKALLAVEPMHPTPSATCCAKHRESRGRAMKLRYSLPIALLFIVMVVPFAGSAAAGPLQVTSGSAGTTSLTFLIRRSSLSAMTLRLKECF